MDTVSHDECEFVNLGVSFPLTDILKRRRMIYCTSQSGYHRMPALIFTGTRKCRAGMSGECRHCETRGDITTAMVGVIEAFHFRRGPKSRPESDSGGGVVAGFGGGGGGGGTLEIVRA
jgi:hypothetical protein